MGLRLFQGLAAALLATFADADCSFTQTCTDPPPGCIPEPLPAPIPPFPLGPLPPMFVACPEYQNLGCCNAQQSETLFISLSLLKSAFGQIPQGGCPACFENARKFWCEFTCSPNQSSFVRNMELVNATNPNTGEEYVVLETRIAVDKAFSCAAYDSCSGVSTVQKDSSLASMEGFFAYQGTVQGIGHGVKILYDFVDGSNNGSTASASTNATGVLQGSVYSCCNYPLSIETGKSTDQGVNTSCPCSACKGMCPGGVCPGNERAGGDAGGSDSFPGLGAVSNDPMQGFQYTTAGVFYAVTATFTLGVTTFQAWWKARKQRKEEEEPRGLSGRLLAEEA